MSGERRIYAIFGVPPEIQAFGMAKFSRSPDALDESIKQISDERASRFLENFYFQYGHTSIADLGHIPVAIENVSHIAALQVTATPFFNGPWDGQESSTRYQNWYNKGFVIPAEIGGQEDRERFCEVAALLLSEYEKLRDTVFDHLCAKIPQPPKMGKREYERTVMARALDAARYVLFLGMKTNLGQIISYRTLEKQIVRFLSSSISEVREMGRDLGKMCNEPAVVPEFWNTSMGEVRVAPTLVKYTNPSPYLINVYPRIAEIAKDVFAGEAPWSDVPIVTLARRQNTRNELLATLLYRVTHYPYIQVQQKVGRIASALKDKIIAAAFEGMGPYDEGIPEFKSGYDFIFDIMMDIGAMRDIHRHRRCVQILQDFTAAHGFSLPQHFEELTLESQTQYCTVMQTVADETAWLEKKYMYAGQYLLPFAFRCRFLLKCDYEELRYLAILRSGVKGNSSYRHIAWLMFKELEKRYPELARIFASRMTSPEIEEPLIR